MTFLKDPLTHFLLAGACLFGLFAVLHQDDEQADDDGALEILLSSNEVALMIQSFSNAWQRLPDDLERQRLLDERVREEIYAREARLRGLDQDDPLIRRRLRERMEFLTENLTVPAEPTDEQLLDYLENHKQNYMVMARYSFDQVLFHTKNRGDQARPQAEALLKKLQDGELAWAPGTLGDTDLLPSGLDDENLIQVARTFGVSVSDALFALKPDGAWHGPVESNFGFFLLRLREIKPAEMPPLEEIRESLTEAWQAEQLEQANDEAYEKLKSRYRVIIEDPS
jgi:hypothetical protein